MPSTFLINHEPLLLSLNKLIILYDSNNITIEGNTDIAFRENVCKRFEACGFDTQVVNDGNDIEAISKAMSSGENIRM